jgi:cytochrome c5
MRSLAVPLLLAALAACKTDPAGPSDGERYLTDPAARREMLVASLVNPDNGYSRLRLAYYETGKSDDWALLPEWNPRVSVIGASELDGGIHASAPLGADARALDPKQDLVALGADAFFRYPVQIAPQAEVAGASRASFDRFGFWSDEAHGAGGLVRVELNDGTHALGYTCATCHASQRNGSLVIGVDNEKIQLGDLALAAAGPGAPPNLVAAWQTWGPGRNDVTTTIGTEPVRIADLRPVRWLTHLQADASVAQHDMATLAIRIETLIITSHERSIRPPREVALGLAAYIWSLADALPTPKASAGEAVFRSHCSACHSQPALTGAPVPLAAVGTDPKIGLSADRGTGTYRVPSLHGAGTRGALFHDASIGSLEELLNPARVEADYAGGRRPGAVVGHTYGLDLDEDSRASLVAYLQTL